MKSNSQGTALQQSEALDGKCLYQVYSNIICINIMYNDMWRLTRQLADLVATGPNVVHLKSFGLAKEKLVALRVESFGPNETEWMAREAPHLHTYSGRRQQQRREIIAGGIGSFLGGGWNCAAVSLPDFCSWMMRYHRRLVLWLNASCNLRKITKNKKN